VGITRSRLTRALLTCAPLTCALLTPGWSAASPCDPLPLSAHTQRTGALSYLTRPPTPDLPESPIVIALHGLGHHKEGLSQLAARLPKRWRLIFVDAPWRYGRGFAWYRYRCPEGAEDLASATARLLTLAQDLSARYPSAPRPALFGFSQGGVVSLSALSEAPARWAAVGSLSGYWLPQAPPRPLPPSPSPAPSLTLAHGAQDEVVTLSRGLEAARLLREAGYAVRWLPFEGAHRVDPDALEGMVEDFEASWRRASALQDPLSPPQERRR
jgi:predicted esterase